MKFQRRHSVDNSLCKLAGASSSASAPLEETHPPPSTRPRIQRRRSLTSIVSLSLIAGSSAFSSHHTSPPSSASRPQIARRASDTCRGPMLAGGERPKMARRMSDRGQVATKMLPVDVAEVATTASDTAAFLGDSSPFTEMPNILASKIYTTELVASAFFGVARSISSDDKMKSELLTDISHIAGDLMGFVTPDQTTLRFGVVLGRVFSIMADYLPDQMIQPEEAIFQACMLGVSTSLLMKNIKPMIAAQCKSTSFHDKRAYLGIFRHFGLSWMQFKSLTAVAADWVELGPNEEMRQSGDEFYWTCKGEVDLVKNDSIIQQFREGLGLLGELDFARKLQMKSRSMQGNKKNTLALSDNGVGISSSSKVRAGPSGAKLLRIDTTKLLELMDHDGQLADSIHSMIFAGMHEKLSRMGLETATAQA